MNSINWPASSVWVFIAQLGEHCSANAEATGSNPVEAPKIFFSGYFRNCLNCDSLRWSHTHFNNANFKKAIRHNMYMVVLLLLILILLSKTIRCLSFRVFPVVVTWLVKYGRDSEIWKDSQMEQISANGLTVGALAFKI